MEIQDLTEIFLNINNTIDFYWNFYAIALISIAAWILSLKKNLLRQLKIVLSLGFLVFAGMNLTGLLWHYAFLDAITIELQALIKAQSFSTSALINTVNQLSFSNYYFVVPMIHIVGDIAILFVIWNNRIRHAVE